MQMFYSVANAGTIFGQGNDRISFFCECKAVMEWADTDNVHGNKADTAYKKYSTADLYISPPQAEICMTM